MQIVIDTSIIFSLFKMDSFTRRLIQSYSMEFIAPPSMIDEVMKYQSLICTKSGLSPDSFSSALREISALCNFHKPSTRYLDKASALISHASDVPFLAIALELQIPLWSNDAHFKSQSVVRVYTTKELAQLLSGSI